MADVTRLSRPATPGTIPVGCDAGFRNLPPRSLSLSLSLALRRERCEHRKLAETLHRSRSPFRSRRRGRRDALSMRTFVDTLDGLIAPRSRSRTSISPARRRCRGRVGDTHTHTYSLFLSLSPRPRAGRSRGRVMYSWDRQCGGHVGYRSQLDRTRCALHGLGRPPPSLSLLRARGAP